MRNKKLTLEQKLSVIDLYFNGGHTIIEIVGITGFSRSVVGRVVKHHKEKYINGDENYIQYPRHYYRKNRQLITIKRKVTDVLNKEIDLIDEKTRLIERLAEIEEEFEALMDKKYNLLNR